MPTDDSASAGGLRPAGPPIAVARGGPFAPLRSGGARLWRALLLAVLVSTLAAPSARQADPFARAADHASQFERAVAASRRVLTVWLTAADPKTLLLPDRLDVAPAERVYTPHNSGADLYPYLILTAELTDPDLYRGRHDGDAAQRGPLHDRAGRRFRRIWT